jgi:hypothetical protein
MLSLEIKGDRDISDIINNKWRCNRPTGIINVSSVVSYLEPAPKSALNVKRPDRPAQNNISEGLPNSDNTSYIFYLDFSIADILTELPQIEVIIPNNYTVIQAVRRALIALNEHLEPKSIEVSLEASDYVPRLSKKNGKPKIDMPCKYGYKLGLDNDQ